MTFVTFLSLLTLWLVTLNFKATYSSCVGTICGNKQLPGVAASKPVTILVYSVWVGEPLEDRLLNHQYYCNENGYEYKHFYQNRTSFKSMVFRSSFDKVTPAAWLSVYVAKELLKTSNADYFFKLDLDNVFIRTDVRLESLIDPLQRYSLYTTNTDPHKRFMQSQSWILKRSAYSEVFVNEWLEYVHWGLCGNLAYEQGAFHLAIGTAYSWHLGTNGTAYDCPRGCSTQRTTYKHHHCVLDWLEDNGFGMSGSMNTHPHIFVYPFPNTTSYNSPDDGFICEITNLKGGLPEIIAPLTVHPMKNHIYATPKEANEYVRGLNK